MGVKDAIAMAAIFGAIALVTPLASTHFGEADQNAAVGAANEANIVDWWGINISPNNDIGLQAASVCVESETPLDVSRIRERFASTIVRLVPNSECASQMVEGDFGMFSAMTYYFDEEGVEAGHLSIPRVECRTSSECIVDIDTIGSGNSYRIRRSAGQWEVI